MLQIIYISITLVYALVETKVKLAKIQRIMSCVPQHWPYCRNFHLSQTVWQNFDCMGYKHLALFSYLNFSTTNHVKSEESRRA